jgi:hypothetical protein
VAATALAFLTIGLLGGAAQASTSSACNDPGRAICIEITDQDLITHSTTSVSRYTKYTTTVSNGGGSALTNGSATVTLKDVVGGNPVPTTAKFVATPAGCRTVSTTAFTCPLPNLAAFAAAPTIGPFFASTSTDTAATATRLVVTATFKEKANDNGSSDPNPDLFSWSENTILEPDEDFSQSVAFLGGSTLLETLPGHRGQSSVFRIPVVAAVPGGFELTTLAEFSLGDTGYFCPTGFSCFGQSVATSAPGIFSATNLANLVTTMDLALLPKGVTEKSLRVHHGLAQPSFTTACGGDLFTTPSLVPCRRVVIDRKAGLVTIDTWDNHQGDWGFS